jgi:hypothetical protein
MADDLNAMTVAELDDFAEANGVDPYPWSGNKAEKIAALETAGFGTPAPVEFKFQLKDDWFASSGAEEKSGSFMAGGDAIDLSGGDVFTTDDPQIAAGLRDLPFLEEAS